MSLWQWNSVHCWAKQHPMITIPPSYAFCLGINKAIACASAELLWTLPSPNVSMPLANASQYILQILYIINTLAALSGSQILLPYSPPPSCSNLYLFPGIDVLLTIPFHILLCQTFCFTNPTYSSVLVYSFVLLESTLRELPLRKHAWDVYFGDTVTSVILHSHVIDSLVGHTILDWKSLFLWISVFPYPLFLVKSPKPFWSSLLWYEWQVFSQGKIKHFLSLVFCNVVMMCFGLAFLNSLDWVLCGLV